MAVPVFVNEWHGLQGSGSSSLTVTKPTNTLDGHGIIVAMGNQNAATYTAPDGTWTKLYERTTNSANTVFFKIADSEPASWTFTCSVSTSNHVLHSLAYSDCAAYDVAYNGAYATSDTTIRALSMNTTVAPTLVIYIASWYYSGGALVTPPSGFTERSTQYQTTIQYMWIAEKEFAGTGATGDVDAVVTSAFIYKNAGMVALYSPTGPAAPVLSASQVGSDIVVTWT